MNKKEKVNWLTLKEAASHLKLSENAFRILLSRNSVNIPKYLIGSRTFRFKMSELDQYLEARESRRRYL